MYARLRRDEGLLRQSGGHSAAIDENRWLHTDDLAIMDGDGYCKIVGRAKDMIIRGGENIYPREIEEFLYACPSISEIQVFGIPDEMFGRNCCVREAEGRRRDHARGNQGILQRKDRQLQDPEAHKDRGRVPNDGDRENPKIPDARNVRRRTWFAKRSLKSKLRSCSPAPKLETGRASWLLPKNRFLSKCRI